MAINNQIIGGNFTDPQGNPLANGYLVFRLSQDEQSSTPGQIASGLAIRVQLDSTGNVPASPATYMFANDALNPANSFYTVDGYTAVGQRAFGPQQQQILSSPSPFNLNAWVPNSINSGSTPAPIPTLETNGVLNGSQKLFNAVAGSGMVISDDGHGNITFSSAGGGSGSLSISSAAAPSTLNLTAEGTFDWLTSSPGGSADPDYQSPAWRWKLLGGGRIAESFRWLSTGNAQPSRESGTSGTGLLLTANAGDEGADAADNFSVPSTPNSPITSLGLWSGISSGSGGTNVGFSFAIDSNSTLRTLRLYLRNQVNAATLSTKVTAHLMDGSASDVNVTLGPDSAYTNYMVTIPFKSASSSRLVVTVLISANGSAFNELDFLALTVA